MERHEVTDAERLTLNLKTVIGLLVGVCGFVFWLLTTQISLANKVEGLQKELTEIKQDVRGLSKVGEIQAQLTTLQARGSDALQKLAEDFAVTKQSIEAFRMNGSPGEEKRMTAIEGRLAVLEKKLEVHEALDEKRMSKP